MSVRSAISALAFIQNYIGAQDVTKNFLVSKALLGMQKMKPTKDNRSPVSIDLLKQLIDTVHLVFQDEFIVILFKAMYALAFFGFLRIGELIKTNSNEDHQLQLRSLAVNHTDKTLTVTSTNPTILL